MKKNLEAKDTALLIHIKHSKPIEMNDFVSSLNAVNSLYSSFVKKRGDSKETSQSKLYVEKIEPGSIDIFLCEFLVSSAIPFMENMNVILEFADYLKRVFNYYTKNEGDKPELSKQECNDFRNTLDIVVADRGAEMAIGAINKGDKNFYFNDCTFNFGDGNAAQNLFSKELEDLKTPNPTDEIYRRVLMKIYQMRNDASGNIGNKAIIDDVFKGKSLGVVFESDELRNKILFPDFNPNKVLFQVDVKVMTVEGKPKAYNIIALHDTIDSE